MSKSLFITEKVGGGGGQRGGGKGGWGVSEEFLGGNHMVLRGNKGRISHNSQSAEQRSHDPKGK